MKHSLSLLKIVFCLACTSCATFDNTSIFDNISSQDNKIFVAKGDSLNNLLKDISVYTYRKGYSYFAFPACIDLKEIKDALPFTMANSIKELKPFVNRPFNTLYKNLSNDRYYQIPYRMKTDTFGMYCWKTQVQEDTNCIFNNFAGDKLIEANCFYANKAFADSLMDECLIIPCPFNSDDLSRDIKIYIQEMLLDQNTFGKSQYDTIGRDYVIIELIYSYNTFYLVGSGYDDVKILFLMNLMRK